MTLARFRPLTALALAASLVALTSCSATSPDDDIPHDDPAGQTLDEARAAIEEIPGITVTEFAGGGEPNVKGNTGYSMSLDIEPGYTVVKGAYFVDYIVRQVWSVGEGWMPNTQLALTTVTADGEPPFSLGAAALTWAPSNGVEAEQRATVIIALDPDDDDAGTRNLKALGKWPGDAPKPLPDGVTVTEG